MKINPKKKNTNKFKLRIRMNIFVLLKFRTLSENDKKSLDPIPKWLVREDYTITTVTWNLHD